MPCLMIPGVISRTLGVEYAKREKAEYRIRDISGSHFIKARYVKSASSISRRVVSVMSLYYGSGSSHYT